MQDTVKEMPKSGRKQASFEDTTQNSYVRDDLGRFQFRNDNDLDIRELETFVNKAIAKGHDTMYLRQGRAADDGTTGQVLITYSKAYCMEQVQKAQQEIDRQGRDGTAQYFIESGDIRIAQPLARGYVKYTGDTVTFAEGDLYEDQGLRGQFFRESTNINITRKESKLDKRTAADVLQNA